MILYDAFICHASEDKNSFVRDLAKSLTDNNVAVWYDEFSLRPGDSIRRAIDAGLSQSRFGIVVLSPRFFEKKWTEWELSGLVQRYLSSGDVRILPIWLEIDHSDVQRYSAPLADIYAVRADIGIEAVTGQLVDLIRPQGSSLVVAREILIGEGLMPPVVTDDWWHQAIEYCGSNDAEGGFQEAMGWGRWGLPLPERGTTAIEKGTRIAFAALQLTWMSEAEEIPITQITEPDKVHEFISRMPGLKNACREFPHYLASYAPQLTIKGFGGEFESAFEEWYQSSLQDQLVLKANGSKSGTALTIDGSIPTCAEALALRDPEFGNYEPAHVSCSFVQGWAVVSGPPVKFYETIDYLIWLLSRSSEWLPANVRQYLLLGMKQWAVWPWFETPGSRSLNGELYNQMFRCKDPVKFRMSKKSMFDLTNRIALTCHVLGLPESPQTLVEQFLQGGFIHTLIEHRLGRR